MNETTRTRLATGMAIALTLIAGSGCAGRGNPAPGPTTRGGGTSNPETPPESWPTEDRGAITMPCKPRRFMVSLNEDDDNGDGTADHRRAIDPATEDNLRVFRFTHPRAARVLVTPVILKADGSNVVGTRVRTWEKDKSTPWDHTKLYPLPATMLLEGKSESPQLDDLGFEYQYFDAAGRPLCGSAAEGSVVDVDAGLRVRSAGGGAFIRNHKMLITADGRAQARVEPELGTHEWSYDGQGTFATPAALSTDFTAGATFTPAASLRQHDMHFILKRDGQVIEAAHHVDLTAPRHLSAAPRGTGQVTSPWASANPGNVVLFRATRIRYQILDQERDPIRDSAYGGRTPQIRENIGRALQSPLPTVQAWIRNTLRHTPNWTDKPSGRFTDRLQASQVPTSIMTQNINGRLSFLPAISNVGDVLMRATPHHAWELSVNGQAATEGCQNTFRVEVSATRQAGGGTQIRFSSEYTVVTP